MHPPVGPPPPPTPHPPHTLSALPPPWTAPAAAEMCAEQLGISREEQDAHAIASVERARAAAQAGLLDWEVAPLEVPAKGGGVRLVKEVGLCRMAALSFGLDGRPLHWPRAALLAGVVVLGYGAGP